MAKKYISTRIGRHLHSRVAKFARRNEFTFQDAVDFLIKEGLGSVASYNL